MEQTEMKPCGRCGCTASVVKKNFKYKCECNGCWTGTQWYRSVDLAITAWNKIADSTAAMNATHRYKYDVCGYTGEVILSGPHSHEDIVMAIVSNLNYFDYEEVPDDEQDETD